MASSYAKSIAVGLMSVHAALACSAALAAEPCEAVDTNLSPARKQEYAVLVASALTTKIKPADVKLQNFMGSGAWSAVYVSTPVSDDGVFFFQDVNGKKTFKEVWGGWADPSEKPSLVKWGKKLGVPDDLASCFADVVTRH